MEGGELLVSRGGGSSLSLEIIKEKVNKKKSNIKKLINAFFYCRGTTDLWGWENDTFLPLDNNIENKKPKTIPPT